MNKMWQRIFQPEYKAWRLWVSIGVSLYYFLFFYFFHPFKDDLVSINEGKMVYSHAVFALIIVCTLISVTILVPKYFPKYFLPENFTIYNFYLLVFICFMIISSFNYFNLFYFFNNDGQYLNFGYYWFNTSLPTFLFTSIPLLLISLFLFNYFTEKDIEAQRIRTQLDSNALEGTPQYEDDKKPEIFHFTDTSNRKNFYIPSDKLYYITSAQNYIEIHYRKKDNIKGRLVLRNSLKALEEDMNLDMNSALIRCHKAFIVNREKVVKLRGPAKASHFILENIEEPIPISRQKFPDLEPQFSFLSEIV
jgi:LytTr DNA-binding domain